MERQVRYNVCVDTAEQERLNAVWTFCIVNEPTEIGRIFGRMMEVFAGREYREAGEHQDIAEGLISGTGSLHYRAFSFASNQSGISQRDQNYIYNVPRKFKRDRRLWSGKDDVWFEETYIPSLK